MNDDIFDKPSEAEIDKIHEVDLKEKMETFYIDYAMSVIASRALPDVRDGLKPVRKSRIVNVPVSSVIPWVNIILMVTAPSTVHWLIWHRTGLPVIL